MGDVTDVSMRPRENWSPRILRFAAKQSHYRLKIVETALFEHQRNTIAIAARKLSYEKYDNQILKTMYNFTENMRFY